MDAATGPTIYTVGHGTRQTDELLDMLTGAGIARLVDVRTAPGSRRNPRFGKDELSRSLRGAGIEYEWRKDLGGLRKARADSPNTAIRNASFRGYADHMATAGFAEGLAWLMDASGQTPTAIMCAESLWWRCHRRMIADALTVRGWRVLHIMDRGQLELHPLHPNVRRSGEVLVYDVQEQLRLPRGGPTPTDRGEA